MFYDNSWEDVAYISSLIAAFCSLFVNGYIITGILMNYRRLSDYQSLIVIQSSVYMVDTAFRFLVNEVSIFTLSPFAAEMGDLWTW